MNLITFSPKNTETNTNKLTLNKDNLDNSYNVHFFLPEVLTNIK